MITFMGDVALISNRLTSQYKPTAPYTFNLEYVIADPTGLMPIPNKINLISPNSNFEELFGSLPIAVNIANNHIFDYGKEGLERTVAFMTGQGVKVISDEPIYITGQLCLFSYVLLPKYSDYAFDLETAQKRIEAAKKNDFRTRVVVQLHWGVENHPIQNENQVRIAHHLIDAGADLIIGHHPHCIQPVEKYKGKFIFYSLGNALFGNISQPSHYDKSGRPSRVYRFRWQNWNRHSYAVVYDETVGEVVRVDKLYQKKNTLICKKSITDVDELTKHQASIGAGLKFKMRKYRLFFASNMFVDGKIFDFNALSHELRKNK